MDFDLREVTEEMNVIADEERARGSSGKLASALREAFTNWRLALLAITGLILSLASGWTTWDGMSNFTCPTGKNDVCIGPRVLSFMITFGIQGVMLIAAWLIGETFAANNATHRTQKSGWFTGGLIAASFVVIVMLALVLTQGASGLLSPDTFLTTDFADYRPGIGAGALVVAAIALFVIVSRREIAGPYLSGALTMLRNIPLWIMFLSCMATSVFFSFDSLFSTIFPEKERKRAAELRVENRVAGVMSDVQQKLARRRLDATRALFASEQWRTFDSNLDKLVTQAQAAPEAVQKQKLDRLSQSRNAQAEIRGLISTSQERTRTLAAERERIQSEIKEISERRAPAQEQVALLEEQLVAKKVEIVTAQTAAEGERQGVRGTGNAGAGPEFRRLQKVVQNLQLDVSELESRLKTAKARVGGLNDEETAKRGRISEIGTQMITLEEKVKEASDRKSVLDQTGQNTLSGDLDAAGGIKALDVARNRFRRAPAEQGLDQLEQLCTSLLANLRGVASLRSATSDVACEPGDASVLANNIFRVQAAEQSFRVACTSGDKMPRGSANKMLKFGSVCIQDSGLPGADTEQFRTELNRIALNRDDKAHRFVVSWNAFDDGNALAYLALAIALAIDGLVFMSGLFGANVIRSPLSFLREEEIERTIDNALGENKYAAITSTVAAIENFPGKPYGSYYHQVVPDIVTGKRDDVERVMAAGRDMGVVRWSTELSPGRYLVHADYNQFLQRTLSRHQTSFVTENSHDPNRSPSEIAEAVIPKLRAALQRNVFENATDVLSYVKPDSSRAGFMGKIEGIHGNRELEITNAFPYLRFARHNVDHVQRVLSVGTAEGLVETNQKRGEYYIRPLLFSTLNDIRAEAAPRTSNVTEMNVEPLTAKGGDDPQSRGNQAVAATTPITILDHEAQVRAGVRALLSDKLKFDERQYKLVMADASASEEVLKSLREQGRRLTDAVARHVEEIADEALESVATRLNEIAGDNQDAVREARKIAIAYAGRRLAPRWKATAKTALARFEEKHTSMSQDGTWLQSSAGDDPHLKALEPRLHDLEIHDDFDQKLVGLIVAAHDAETRLDEMAAQSEDLPSVPSRRAVND